MTLAVFLGPSLPLDEARRLLPDATYLPPARQADLVSLLDDPPAAIGLVDGEFHQSRSVWHKEILLALERGVHVFGAASMGALRAAELERYGMIGVGAVFEQYASGRLTDDDEVALRYSRDDGCYVPLSEPMVNIRATLAAAREAGLPRDLCGLAEREAKRLYYPDRCRRAVVDRLRAMDVAGVHVLDAFWRDSAVDVKAADARLLLTTLKEFAADPPPPRRHDEETFRTAGLDTLDDRERRVRGANREIPLADIADAAQLWHPDAAASNAAALDRGLVLVLSELLHVKPTETQIEQEIGRWRVRHGHTDDASFESWLRRNHLSEGEFHLLAADAARRRLLWRWLLNARHVERSTRLVLDKLRWDDEYETWAHAAAETADGEPLIEELADVDPADLVREQGLMVDTDIATWAEEAGFNSPEHLLLALTRKVKHL
ncbi:TfuA-like protein [Microbispora sp. KK1-11]|uniref:TfuA-like protein n=1 Tax=Microbispora sp. KK1-11 TaxID=2053005 RepID=UPI0011590AF0|nr:TfuA-like protein [Microbispora sp. KK1-11]TQS25183.1 hypothetical protein FLW16_32180 [Microbispora sp. KK1-11]